MNREEAKALAKQLYADGVPVPKIADKIYEAGYKSLRTGGKLGLGGVYDLMGRATASKKNPQPQPRTLFKEPSYLKVDSKPPPPPAPAPPAPSNENPADQIMVIITRPDQLKDIMKGFLK